MLNNLLDNLKTQDKIWIIGHDNPDVDSILSGILLSNFLTSLNISNEFCIKNTTVEKETTNILKDLFGIDVKNYYNSEENSEDILFLVDHYETKHAGKVIACIDHHYTDTYISYPFYYYHPSCSTSYIVYELMLEAGYIMSKNEAKMLIGSMMVDTVSFKSEKTVKEEVEIAKKIAEQYNLDYSSLEKHSLSLTDIDNLSVDEIVNNGYKYYNFNGHKVKSSYIQIYEDWFEALPKEWYYSIARSLKPEGLDMWVFIIFDCKNNITYEYRFCINGTVEKVVSPKFLSRGKNIMPEIEKMYS